VNRGMWFHPLAGILPALIPIPSHPVAQRKRLMHARRLVAACCSASSRAGAGMTGDRLSSIGRLASGMAVETGSQMLPGLALVGQPCHLTIAEATLGRHRAMPISQGP
jgi:hypothetical protein